MSTQDQIEWGRHYIQRAYGQPAPIPGSKKHDAAALRAAVQVIRRRRKRQTFAGDVIIRVLERSAERLEKDA